jgi:hypothetical protein
MSIVNTIDVSTIYHGCRLDQPWTFNQGMIWINLGDSFPLPQVMNLNVSFNDTMLSVFYREPNYNLVGANLNSNQAFAPTISSTEYPASVSLKLRLTWPQGSMEQNWSVYPYVTKKRVCGGDFPIETISRQMITSNLKSASNSLSPWEFLMDGFILILTLFLL